MTDIASLGIKIESSDIRKAVDELDRLEKKSGDTERATDKLSTSVKAFGVFAAAAAVAAAGMFARAVINNSIEQERVIAQLNATLKSTKNAAGLTSNELQLMAASLQQVTTFGDETIIGAQSLLLTFTQIGRETFPLATKTVLDMSIAMGQDLKSSAIQVGKALNDPVEGINALTRVGVKFTDQQKDMIKALAESGDLAGAQSIILRELQTEFGGSAEAARNTLGGALDALKNSFGDLLEADGDSLPGLTGAINEMTATLNDPKVKEGFGALATSIVTIVTEIAKATASIGSFFGTVSTTAEWFEAYQNDHIGFFEWLTTGNETAAKRLDEIRAKMVSVAEANTMATSPPAISSPGDESAGPPGLPMPTDSQIQEWKTRDEAIFAMEQDAERLKNEERALVLAEGQEAKRLLLMQYYADEEKFAREAADKQAEIEKRKKDDQIKNGEQAFSTMIGQMAGHNKAFFNIQKIYRLSKLAMEAPAAIADAFAWGDSWGGPPAGFAMAGIAGAAMAGYAGQLMGAQYGGTSAGGSSGGGSGSPVTATPQPGATTLFPQNEQSQVRGTVQFIIQGDFIGEDSYVQNKLMPAIKTYIADYDYVLIESNSRNGQALRA